VTHYFKLGPLDTTLRYQADLRHDLGAIIDKAGGAKAVLACGSVETENYQVPMVAWYLGVESVDVSDVRPGVTANVILQTRATRTAALSPLTPPRRHYTETTLGTFRLFEHCRDGG